VTTTSRRGTQGDVRAWRWLYWDARQRRGGKPAGFASQATSPSSEAKRVGPIQPTVVSGEIAGSCTDTRHSCVWSRDVVRVVAGTGTYLSGINDTGDVVGGTFIEEEGPLNAFIISRRGMLTDLGPGVNARTRAGVSLAPEGAALAADINDRGEIVGLTHDEEGNSQIVIWRLHGSK
jgi:hypothetical protein